MKRASSLCHTKWECKFHIVWIPKRRRKILYGKLKGYLGEVFHKLAAERECRIVEEHLCPDYVHICIEMPLKHPVSQIIGYLKGKHAIHIAREVEGRARNFVGKFFGHVDTLYPQ